MVGVDFLSAFLSPGRTLASRVDAEAEADAGSGVDFLGSFIARSRSRRATGACAVDDEDDHGCDELREIEEVFGISTRHVACERGRTAAASKSDPICVVEEGAVIDLGDPDDPASDDPWSVCTSDWSSDAGSEGSAVFGADAVAMVLPTPLPPLATICTWAGHASDEKTLVDALVARGLPV